MFDQSISYNYSISFLSKGLVLSLRAIIPTESNLLGDFQKNFSDFRKIRCEINAGLVINQAGVQNYLLQSHYNIKVLGRMRHTGLPKSISKINKGNKAIKMNHSPLRTLQSLSAHKQNPKQNKNQTSRSIHKINSKQKPNRSYSSSPNQTERNISSYAPVTQFKYWQTSQQKKISHHNHNQPITLVKQMEDEQDSSFVKQIKKMMQGLTSRQKSKTRRTDLTLKGSEQKSHYKEQRSEVKEEKSRWLTPNFSIDSKNKQLFGNQEHKCSINLKDRIWTKYQGEYSSQKKSGYGVLYFINGDKFIGNFAEDQPTGHGTYYDNINEIIIMGLWKNGELIGFPIFSDYSKFKKE